MHRFRLSQTDLIDHFSIMTIKHLVFTKKQLFKVRHSDAYWLPFQP
jgi:hypothetical protein